MKIPTKKINLIPMNVYLFEHQIKELHRTMSIVIPKMKGIPVEIKGLKSINIYIYIYIFTVVFYELDHLKEQIVKDQEQKQLRVLQRSKRKKRRIKK
jgi:hypothetical protein